MLRQTELVTASPEDTRRVAATIAAALRPGDVVSLTGDLGAGKTCFVQGAAAELGVTDRVTSPSFLLRREYHGRVDVLHLDVYRLDTLQEVLDVGYEDVLGRSHVTFIEWGDAMSPLLPPDHLEVELHLADPDGLVPAGPDGLAPADPPDPDRGDEPRRILVRPRGDDWLRRFVGLSADLGPWKPPGQHPEQDG